MFPDTPQTLLRKIADLAQGDDAAEWEMFVELYTPPLKRFVKLLSSTLSDADVEDVIQDVFVRLVDVLREGKIDRTKAKFRAYLASVTRRILIDRYRETLVRPQLSETADDSDEVRALSHESHAYSGSVMEVDPGVLLDVRWRLAVHLSAVDHILTKTAISAQSKQIYEMLEQGLSIREVAERLNVSRDAVKQVKSRLDRAISALEQKLLK